MKTLHFVMKYVWFCLSMLFWVIFVNTEGQGAWQRAIFCLLAAIWSQWEADDD